MTNEKTLVNPLKITDTTLRDAHQSLFATRMRTADMEAIAAQMDEAGFYSMEVWGGATFDVTTRFLAEDPWERVRVLKKLMPRTPLQMLLRGQNLVGYRNYPDDVVRAFVEHAAEVGIDIFRVFDAVNDERNFQTAVEAIKESGKHFQACICYSVTEEGRLGGPVFNLDYFVNKALLLQDMGADSLCIKDMAGLLAPYDAYELVKALKAKIKIPIQLHMHYTSGMASMAALKAIEAGVDIVDTCLSPFALRTSQPAVEPLVVTLRGGPRDTGLDLDYLVRLSEYFESIAPKYLDLLESNKVSVIDARVLSHQIPGGMTSNLISQLREADAIDKLDQVLADLPLTRKELGYPPLVTPTSQIVGVQAVSNVLFGRYKMVSGQMKDYVYGLYGRPPVPIDPDVVSTVLKGYERGEEPISGRPADYLEPELESAKGATRDIARDIGDVLIYALYPTTGMKFLRMKYGLESVPPEMQPKTLEQAKEKQELVAKAKAGLLTEKSAPVTERTAPEPAPPAPPRSARARVFNVYVGDEFFRVEVDPARPGQGFTASPSSRPAPAASPQSPDPSPQVAEAAPAVAPKVTEGQETVAAPMPGTLIRYEVEAGQAVKAGDTVAILEAMKMENALPSPVDGVVSALTTQPGAKVAKGDTLVIIDT